VAQGVGPEFKVPVPQKERKKERKKEMAEGRRTREDELPL
jgi:hypothetical protein